MAIRIWGHRGHRHHRYPRFEKLQGHENSLQAYDFTLSQCMGLECDVVQSRQQSVYLVHDTAFDSMVHYELRAHLSEASQQAVGSHFIFDLTDDMLAEVTLKDGQKLPKLTQLFDLAARFPWAELNLELKGPYVTDIAIRTTEHAIQRGLIKPDNVIFSSFNWPALRDVRDNTGRRFKIGALFALPTQQQTQMFPNWPKSPQDAYYMPFSPEILQHDLIKAIQPDYLHLELSAVTPHALFAIHQLIPDVKIVIWTAGEKHPDEQITDPQQDLLGVLTELAQNPMLYGMVYAAITDFPLTIQQRLLARGLPVVVNPRVMPRQQG